MSPSAGFSRPRFNRVPREFIKWKKGKKGRKKEGKRRTKKERKKGCDCRAIAVHFSGLLCAPLFFGALVQPGVGRSPPCLRDTRRKNKAKGEAETGDCRAIAAHCSGLLCGLCFFGSGPTVNGQQQQITKRTIDLLPFQSGLLTVDRWPLAEKTQGRRTTRCNARQLHGNRPPLRRPCLTCHCPP